MLAFFQVRAIPIDPSTFLFFRLVFVGLIFALLILIYQIIRPWEGRDKAYGLLLVMALLVALVSATI